MSEGGTPTSVAACAKVLIDAAKTVFGAGVVVLIFFGLALVFLAAGSGNLESALRGSLMFWLLSSMLVVLFAMILLRLFKPIGLGGPPVPRTEQVEITNSGVDE